MFIEHVLTRHMRARMRKAMRFRPSPPAFGGSPPKQTTDGPILLYLHIPFCDQLCPYCSFNRIEFEPGVAKEYFNCLRREIHLYDRLGYHFDSVYVGGGTPTILPGELESTLRLVKRLWSIKHVSTETNPNHLTPENLGLLRELGVNRLSVGVQSFNDQVLREIGRYERYGSGWQIQQQLRAVRGVFETLNIDLIFNYPMQTDRMLLQDLETAKTIEADQITFYPLMSPRANEHNGNGRSPGQRTRERVFYGLIREELADAYIPSSAWCFTRKGLDNRWRENSIDEYIVDNDHYAGLGSGSFGYIAGTLYSNTFQITQYIDLLQKGILPIVAEKRFSRLEQIRYDFLMKLFGGSLDRSYLEGKYRGAAILHVWKELLFFVLAGAIRVKNREITLTEKGYYLWVVLMREFFTGVNIFREHCMSFNRSETAAVRTSQSHPD
ncbi:MAG: coproporphyrinogen III oxidase family protein [Spirochaetaceae bacterium]|nr:MAG: coproporphyrinogen III oxidase family protein [Spirochaetaceae bacterium]